jgi:hypothetical protein
MKAPKVQGLMDLVAFDWIDFYADIEGVDTAIAARLVLDDPPIRYLLDRLEFVRFPSGGPVTAVGVRKLPVDSVVSLACLNFGLNGWAGGLMNEGVVYTTSEMDEAVQLRQQGIKDPDALAYVAYTYVRYGLLGQPPVEWVARMYSCSLRTATRWVAAARQSGYLPAKEPAARTPVGETTGRDD